MAAEFPLSLVIKAVDRATAPLRAINQRMQQITAPVRKLNNAFRAMAEEAGVFRLWKGFTGVGSAIGKVGHEAVALGLKVGAMAVGAGYALYGLVRGAVDAGDKLSEMAQRVGLSVDAYAQLRFAAGQADVEQEQFNGAMDHFARALGDAKAGGGPLLDFLLKVSPALAMQVRGTKSTEQALDLMTQAFEKLQDPTKIAALSAASFGRNGLQMGQALHQGTRAIVEQRQEYRRLAGSQQAYADASSEVDNAFRKVNAAFEGVRGAALVGLAPAITTLSKALTTFLAEHREGIAKWAGETGAAISKWVSEGGLEQTAKSIRELADAIKPLLKWLGNGDGLVGALKLVALVMGAPLLSAIGSLALALVGPIIASLGTFVGALLGGGTAMEAFTAVLLANPLGLVIAGVTALGLVAYELYKHWEPVKKFFEDLWGTLKSIFASPLESIGKALKWIFPAATWDASAARPALGAASAGVPAMLARQSEAKVTVDFLNLPRGARVTTDPQSTAEVDTSMGFSMVTQ